MGDKVDIESMLKNIISQKAKEANTKAIWKAESKFKKLLGLTIDTRGSIGEAFIAEALKQASYKVEFNSQTDPRKKHWDIKVNNKYTFEVKTASLGNSAKTFQHENIEKDRDYTALVLLDIGPDEIYLTVAPVDTLPFTIPNNNWTIQKKKMHRRRSAIYLKWDLSLSDVKDRQVKTLDEIVAMFRPIIG